MLVDPRGVSVGGNIGSVYASVDLTKITRFLFSPRKPPSARNIFTQICFVASFGEMAAEFRPIDMSSKTLPEGWCVSFKLFLVSV